LRCQRISVPGFTIVRIRRQSIKPRRWYRERFSHGRRLRRIGIVALARKLLIAWWRYLETGILPDGAIVKPGVV
jgi:hypothetical protein